MSEPTGREGVPLSLRAAGLAVSTATIVTYAARRVYELATAKASAVIGGGSPKQGSAEAPR